MAAMPQAFSPDDLLLHRRANELECAPDRPVAACTVIRLDPQADCERSTIWLLDLQGGPPRTFTAGTGLDSTPRWSPDGRRLAFRSDRDGALRVHLLPLDGGEARAVGCLPGAVADLRWLPDGRGLVLTAAVPVDPDWAGERPQGRQARDTGPEVAWKLPYKSDGLSFMLAREIHLFQLDLQTGAHRQLTDGPFDVFDFAVSPDGAQLAYVRTREGRLAHRNELWLCDAGGSAHRCLVRDHPTVMGPSWSPDGRWIAFAASLEEGEAGTGLFLLACDTGRVQRLSDPELLLGEPQVLRWEADGSGLLCTRAHRGRHEVVRIAVPDGRLHVLWSGDGHFTAFDAGPTHLVVATEHPAQASEVHACPRAGGAARQVSDFNPWWRDRTPLHAELRTFEAPDGQGGRETVEGWLLRAAQAQASSPLLVDVHGGPASYVLLDFDSAVYWRVLCARGWMVLALNAVGSASYGRAFRDRLAGRWGELDLPQHLAAVRQLQGEGVCDARVAIAGKSYGGYLAAWAIGHSDVFRAAVISAPVADIEAHCGSSDGGYYADPWFMGDPARLDRALAHQLSPLPALEQATTPTLLLQGAADERCPKAQSEALFVTLMHRSRAPARLVLYPDQGHGFLAGGPPSVRRDANRRIVDWLEAHAGGTGH